VQVSPGGPFYFSKPSDAHLLLSISTLNEQKIVEGVRRLANAMSQMLPRRKS
jgi:DNA-binding transcriptional MocR family regulator